MRHIVQHAILKTIRPQIVEYICDKCGKVCGTKTNPKITTTGGSFSEDGHFCKRDPDCNPFHPSRWRR